MANSAGASKSSNAPHCLAASLFLAWLLSACGASQQPERPAWPAQPAPSYPAPAEPQGPTAGVSEQTPGAGGSLAKAAPPGAEGGPSSPLAARFEKKRAIQTLRGKATYYADSLAGNHTANGDVYDPKKHSAAHRKLPFGTIVRVTRVDNGAVTYVRINDRGPFGGGGRIIDLSKAAAKDLEMLRAGVVQVRVEVLERPKK